MEEKIINELTNVAAAFIKRVYMIAKENDLIPQDVLLQQISFILQLLSEEDVERMIFE